MSDGREEREEQKQRKEQEKSQDRGDWVDRYNPDPWEPERQDS